MYRKIEEKIKNRDKKSNKKPLVVIGVRQSGKSYIIDKYCKENYSNYIKIDLSRDDNFKDIFEKNNNFEKRKEVLCITYNINFDDKDTILFVDEAQKCPKFIEDLKPFQEDGINNIIVAGSLLDVTVKNMNESYPVGKTHILDLYPMNFEEYLIATGNERFISIIKNCFDNDVPCDYHDLLMDLYYRYIFNGGMPEMLQNYLDHDLDISKTDYEILDDIYKEYQNDITKHVIDDKEKHRIRVIYENIAPQLMKENPKFMYAKLESKSKKADYIYALDWLVNSHMIIKCNQLTKPEYPLAGFSDDNNYKLYLSDIGLLRNKLKIDALDIFTNGNYSYKGVLTENFIAMELLNQFGSIYYWTKKGSENNNKAEVDFVIQISGKVIPIEVKSSNNRTQSLNVYNELFHPELMIKVGDVNFGKVNNLKTIPLYAAFLIKECLEEMFK